MSTKELIWAIVLLQLGIFAALLIIAADLKYVLDRGLP